MGVAMESWWEGLTVLNKWFAVSAVFFSVLFLWQVISMLVGIDLEGHADTGPDGFDHGDVDASAGHDGVDHTDGAGDHHHNSVGGEIAFTLVSVRSVIAFATLFSWAGTLYLMTGTTAVLAVGYSLGWGLAAMFGVSFLVYKLLQMQETGNISIWGCIGEEGQVYMDIPPGGFGKIRVMVTGVLSFVNARSSGDEPLPAGTKVRVSRIIDSNTVEVVSIEKGEGD